MTFSITFSINFHDRLNLVICNTYNAKTFFVIISSLSFYYKISITNIVFSKPFLGPHFSNLFKICSNNYRFLDPFKIRWVPKWRPKSAKWCQNGTGEFTARLPRTVPEATLHPRRRLKRPRSYFS